MAVHLDLPMCREAALGAAGRLGSLLRRRSDPGEGNTAAPSTVARDTDEGSRSGGIGRCAPICRQLSKMRPIRRSKMRSTVCCGLVCRVLGSDAGQGVDSAVAQPVAGAFQREDIEMVDDTVDHRAEALPGLTSTGGRAL